MHELPTQTRGSPGLLRVTVSSQDPLQTGVTEGLSDVDEPEFYLAESESRAVCDKAGRMELGFSRRQRAILPSPPPKSHVKGCLRTWQVDQNSPLSHGEGLKTLG